jgi:LDH2 family malate/lactate/ureidoglycolate dehydrogenase
VDGGGGLGIPAMNFAVEMLIPRARAQGIAAAGVVRVGHTGRVGAYVEAAAAAGLFALCLGGGGHAKWASVVPYGGAEPVMSTNPYALALPGDAEGPLAVDFATSASANGKIALAAREGRSLPPGTIIDRAGRPSTDPADFAAGGALLPMGGPKGSGMGLVAELLGLLLGEIAEFNWLLIALDLSRFGDPAQARATAERYLARVRGTRPAPGHERVKLPGQWELELAAERRRAGLPLSDAVIAGIAEAAESQGIVPAAYLPATS